MAQPPDYGITDGDSNVITLDFMQDPTMDGRMLEFVKALSKDGIRELLESGRQYGKIMEKRGDFACLDRR